MLGNGAAIVIVINISVRFAMFSESCRKYISAKLIDVVVAPSCNDVLELLAAYITSIAHVLVSVKFSADNLERFTDPIKLKAELHEKIFFQVGFVSDSSIS